MVTTYKKQPKYYIPGVFLVNPSINTINVSGTLTRVNYNPITFNSFSNGTPYDD